MNESQAAPIVLVHGILGFDQLKLAGLNIAGYFRQIPEALRKDGHVVPEPPQLNPAGSIAERAQDLKNYLQDPSNHDVFDKQVHLVAHSMGGLDARFMIAKLGMADQVLSLTTIGTPHHGSPIEDIIIAGTHPALNQLVELGIDVKGAFDLTTGASRQFNDDVPDSPGIAYFSIGGQFQPHRILGVPQGPLGLTHDIIAATDNGNDGLVSVASATFAERPETWTTLDAWDANHFRLVNWGTDLVPSPLELMDHSIVHRYRSLATRVKELVRLRS
jgi:triacylglycerol lipase